MPRLSLSRVRELVRALNYVITLHAAEELADDNLTILDLESVILTGQIVERQRDHRTREVKAVIRGETLHGIEAETIVKYGHTGELYIITIYVT